LIGRVDSRGIPLNVLVEYYFAEIGEEKIPVKLYLVQFIESITSLGSDRYPGVGTGNFLNNDALR